jgi:hypothetical protein
VRWRPLKPKALLVMGIGALLLFSGLAVARWRVRASAPLHTAGSSVFAVRTEVEFDTGEAAPHRTTLEGTGTVLFGRFVLTVAHAVTMEQLEVTVRTAHGDLTLPVEGRRLSERTWLVAGENQVPLTLLARDAESDVALFMLPGKTTLPSFPYPLGNSEALDLGDPIGLLGVDPMAGVLFRRGSVVALRGSELVASVSSNNRVFLISLALARGESGAPVVASRDGAWELVGLAQGTYIGPRQLAWAIRIGPALEALSRQDGVKAVRQFLRLCREARVAHTAGPVERLPAAGAPPTERATR